MAIATAPRRLRKVSAAVEMIGPKEAEAMLGGNTHNRHVRVTRVSHYTRAMLDDEWTLNGETIKVSDTGKLLDGQHRLLAVIEAGKRAPFVVVRGLEESVQETVDIGDKRTLGDTLMLRGEQNWTTLGAALMTAYRIQKGLFQQTRAWPTNQELLDWLDVNPRIRDSFTVANQAVRNALRYPPSQAMALHFVMSEVASEDEANAFWAGLFEGSDLDEKSPILALRNFLIRDLVQHRRSSVRYRIAVTVKVWNAVRGGYPTAARWVMSGKNAEPFPTIK